MLTPRSSRTSPCCRPEASTRNDPRRLSAICEKSTFLQYLMEETAPSGPLEDQRIMLATGSPRTVLGKAAVGLEPLWFGGTRCCTISEMRRLEGSSGSVGKRRRWSAEPAAGKLGHSRSFPAVRLRWPGSGCGRGDLPVAIVSEPRTGLGVGVAFDRHLFWRLFGFYASLIRISWLCSMGLESHSRKTFYSLLPAVGSPAFGGDGYLDVVVERVKVDVVTHGLQQLVLQLFSVTP
jgi:hypothetical protein